jgi:hypothetical protein
LKGEQTVEEQTVTKNRSRHFNPIRIWLTSIIAEHNLHALIDPVKVANAALPHLTADTQLLAAEFYLRQVTRSLLGQKPSSNTVLPGFKFLHRRYPTTERGGYVPIEDLGRNDIRWNVARLRREGMARLAHADELELYEPEPGVA